MKQPLLSIGIIFKNNIRSIERCLQALQPLRGAISCELVMADTGSDDGSRAVAQRYADILFDFPWINDFSAARNAVMDRCSGKWYFTVDTDEYLDEDISELVDFLHSPRAETTPGLLAIQRNYVSAVDARQYVDFNAFRLVRMNTGARYHGRIHETFPRMSLTENDILRNTVLWHDGYLDFENGETHEKKKKRNLELLELSLEQEPDNLYRLIQAYESSYNEEIRCRYARRLVETVNWKENVEPHLAAACYRHAVNCARRHGLPEYAQWLAHATQTYADSIYTQVDVQYMMLLDADARGDHAAVREHSERYLHNLRRVSAASGELGVSALIYNAKANRDFALVLQANACVQLDQHNAAEEILRANPPMELSISAMLAWFDVAAQGYPQIDVRDVVARVGDFLWQDAADSQRITLRDSFVEHMHQDCFDPESTVVSQNRAMYTLLSALGNCDLAREAAILAEDSSEKITLAAEEIEDWNGASVLCVARLMAAGQPLPERFFRQLSTAKLEEAAVRLAQCVGADFAELAAAWTQAQRDDAPMKQQLFYYDLSVAAFLAANWEDDKTHPEEVFAFFAAQSEKFLARYYHPDLLNGAEQDALPPMHYFGWICVQVSYCLQSNAFAQAVQMFRTGLQAAPTVKKAVEYLVNYVERLTRPAPSAELLALAEQVKTILAAYPADDPAVVQLKQTPVYQQVAYLIEG